MTDRLPFTTGYGVRAEEKEHLSIDLPPEAVAPSGCTSISISVRLAPFTNVPTLTIYTDNVPGEMAIQLVDGRGNTHDIWERDDFKVAP